MTWDTLPTEIQSLILTEIASLPGHELQAEPTDKPHLRWSRIHVSAIHRDWSGCILCDDVRRCLLVCSRWTELLRGLLPIHAPTELVLAQGTEKQATKAVQCWLSRGRSTRDAVLPWYNGRRDLLELSVERGLANCTRLLLDLVPRDEISRHWQEKNWCKWYPHIAASKGQTVPLQIMHELGLSISEWGFPHVCTPLAIAIFRDHVQTVDFLLSLDASPDLRVARPPQRDDDNDQGYFRGPPLTPMQLAARQGSLEMVKVLIKHGLHTHGRNGGPQARRTPLMWALQRRNLYLDAVSETACLIAEHSDASEFDVDDPRLVKMAITGGGSVALVRSLMVRGAGVRQTQRFPRISPLDAAVCLGKGEIIRLLIDNGATCSRRAIDWAMKHGQGDLVKLLIPRCDAEIPSDKL
ncbi:ankyrin repeat-containing domain protein [Aspergillus lucknowensis]|uniref:Ankyrin repeat-containing domain protein n=1 Tax=Aspergillus lucknowensis TaxID=176173 RepID=A0ABR4M027_9EURO